MEYRHKKRFSSWKIYKGCVYDTTKGLCFVHSNYMNKVCKLKKSIYGLANILKLESVSLWKIWEIHNVS